MSFAELAVKPDNGFDLGPTSGLGTTFQVLPSQCRIKVRLGSLSAFAGVKKPTAQALFGDSASTASSLFVPLVTFGVATSAHSEPFQCMAKVWPFAPLNPTAQASFVASADTPKRDSPVGGCCIVVAVHAVPSQCSKMLKPAPGASPRLPTAQMSFAEVEAMPNSSV